MDQRVHVLGEEQIYHEADDLAGREVLARGLVGLLRELADQLLEDVAHVLVGDVGRVEVEVGKPLDDAEQEVSVLQPVHLVEELEVDADGLPDVGREGVDIGLEVVGKVGGVLKQLAEVVGRRVVEPVP